MADNFKNATVETHANPSGHPNVTNLAPKNAPKYEAKFKMDQKVKHPPDTSARFEGGTGTIVEVNPNDEKGFLYKVKCDKSGTVLPVDFKESELS